MLPEPPELLLIIDDDKTMRLFFQYALNDLAVNNNMYIRAVGSLEEAKTILLTTKTRLLLVDWNLGNSESIMYGFVNSFENTVICTSNPEDIRVELLATAVILNKIDPLLKHKIFEVCNGIINRV